MSFAKYPKNLNTTEPERDMIMSIFGKHLLRAKKAMMGVSTLIIFISAVLTSAVAAAVIVRTVGIMQERSFAVTTEVRDRLVTALDFVSVIGYSNLTSQKMYGFDVMVRLRPGSFSYGLGTMGLSFTNDKISTSAKLQHTENEDYDYEFSNLTTTKYALFDMDKDKRTDYVSIVNDGDGVNEILLFEFSKGDTANVTLGANFDGGASFASLNDTPIIGESGSWYGFIQLHGDVGPAVISMGQNSTSWFRLTHYPEIDWCDFSVLIPDTAFCYESRLGNDDTAVSKGEIYVVRFRLSEDYLQNPDETFEIKLIPKKGDFTSIEGTSPDSFVRSMGQVWPTAT